MQGAYHLCSCNFTTDYTLCTDHTKKRKVCMKCSRRINTELRVRMRRWLTFSFHSTPLLYHASLLNSALINQVTSHFSMEGIIFFDGLWSGVRAKIKKRKMSEAVFLALLSKWTDEWKSLRPNRIFIKPAVANFKRRHVPTVIWIPGNKKSKISKRNPKRHYLKN